MSKEFTGTTWRFTVDDDGKLHPNKAFWYTVAVTSVGYIGSLSALKPLFSLGVQRMRPEKKFFMMIARGIPLHAAASKLMVDIFKTVGRGTAKDLEAFQDALEHSKKVRTAYTEPVKAKYKADVSKEGHKDLDATFMSGSDLSNLIDELVKKYMESNSNKPNKKDDEEEGSDD